MRNADCGKAETLIQKTEDEDEEEDEDDKKCGMRSAECGETESGTLFF